jgi:hypothetical protein
MAWKAKNYGRMAAQLASLTREDTPGKSAGRVRDEYMLFELEDFRIVRIDFQAPVICEIDVELTIDGETKIGRIRWIRETGPRNMVSLDAKTEYATVRNKLAEAAKDQLRFYADRSEALIVCLANPKGISVPINSIQEMLEAMNGDLGFAVPINTNTGGPAGEGSMFFGRNGAFVDSHRYVSAVMTLHRGILAAEAVERWCDENRPRWAGIKDRRQRTEAVAQAALDDDALRVAEAIEGEFYFVRVFESRWAALGEAVPVSRDLFVGPRDEFWAIDRETGTVALATA